MKRITIIGGSLGSGGAEHQCAQLMNMLVEKGYDVTFVSFTDVEDHYPTSPKIHRVHIGRGQSNEKRLLKLEWYILTVKTDVLLAFSQRMSVLSLFMMLFRPDVKVISSERNFTIDAPDKWEKILMKTGIYRRSNFVVPNNYSQGRYLAEKMPALKNKIQVITNYTEIDKYVSTPVPCNEIPRIGIFCRFEKQKNFHRFLEALYILNVRNNYKYKYHIDWYGNHSFPSEEQTKYFEEGVQKIHDYKLDDYITIHNPTREVNKLIPTFDVMCLPSLHEGFSNSISEYICCGRPVICSDVSDNSLMVHDGENGFLFDPLNVESIMEAFVRYFDISAEQRDKMGVRSREIAESLFDKNKFIESYIKLIEA